MVLVWGRLIQREKERAETHYLIAKVHRERVSHRGIAPVTGLNRKPVATIVKKAAHIKSLVRKILPCYPFRSGHYATNACSRLDCERCAIARAATSMQVNVA